MCVCMCICMCLLTREREREGLCTEFLQGLTVMELKVHPLYRLKHSRLHFSGVIGAEPVGIIPRVIITIGMNMNIT